MLHGTKAEGKRGARAAAAPAPPTKPARVPPPPTWLGTDGRKHWRQLAPKLVDKGRLQDLHLSQFAQLCDAWDRYHWARSCRPKKIRGKGFPPSLAIEKQALADYCRLAMLFGLNPAADGRLNEAYLPGESGAGGEPPSSSSSASDAGDADLDAQWQAKYGRGHGG